MRGAPSGHSHIHAVAGIIPAYAGSTCASPSSLRHAGDHPRVCGEHSTQVQEAALEQGSSPRMRGALGAAAKDTIKAGIIPAYAGSTNRNSWEIPRFWDHPRVCGEHFSATSPIMTSTGSSPRMRGAQAKAYDPNDTNGIIPAYAGSTAAVLPVLLLSRDHPRVCGEHESPDSQPLRRSGSSPRMRGALAGNPAGVLMGGIIPAYAGSTTFSASVNGA